MINYVPRKQDIVWLDFDPASGRELKKRRPALVISNDGYNQLTRLALVCPITHANNNNLRKTDLLIPITGYPDVEGFINPLQLHTYDYSARNVKKIDELDDETFFSVLRIINDIVR